MYCQSNRLEIVRSYCYQVKDSDDSECWLVSCLFTATLFPFLFSSPRIDWDNFSKWHFSAQAQAFKQHLSLVRKYSHFQILPSIIWKFFLVLWEENLDWRFCFLRTSNQCLVSFINHVDLIHLLEGLTEPTCAQTPFLARVARHWMVFRLDTTRLGPPWLAAREACSLNWGEIIRVINKLSSSEVQSNNHSLHCTSVGWLCYLSCSGSVGLDPRWLIISSELMMSVRGWL